MKRPLLTHANLNLLLSGIIISSCYATIKRQQIGLRDIINPSQQLQISQWSGPFFSDDGQKSAYQRLVSGDSRGDKRMLIDGIDPERILNPLPEKPIKKAVKPQLPEAETYIGANPDQEKEVYVSPQERLASLVSKPIIHDSVETENAKSRSHTHEGEEKFVNRGSSRKYMFNPNRGNEDEDAESEEGRERSDLQSSHISNEDEEDPDGITKPQEIQSFAGSDDHSESKEDFHSDSLDGPDTLENMEKSPEEEHSNVHDDGQSDREMERDQGEDDRENDPGRRSTVDRPEKAPPSTKFKISKASSAAFNQKGLRRTSTPSKKNTRDRKLAVASKKSIPSSPLGNRIPEVLMPGGIPDPIIQGHYQDDLIQQYPMLDTAHAQKLPAQDVHALTPAFNAELDSRNGDGNVLLQGVTPLTMSGVALNSHSGVEEINHERELSLRHHAEGLSLENVDESKAMNHTAEVPEIADSEYGVPSEKLESLDRNLEAMQNMAGHERSGHEVALQDVATPETIFVHHHAGKKPASTNVESRKNATAEAHQKRTHKSKERVRRAISRKRKAMKSNNKKSEVFLTNAASFVGRKNVTVNGTAGADKVQKRFFGSTEHQSGFLEENTAAELDGHVGEFTGDAPHLMTIGTHDGSDTHKEWNNMHSPGNGYYSGAGEGPARTQEGEYIHHNQDDGEEGMHADAFGGFGHMGHTFGGGHHSDVGWGVHDMGHSMGYGGSGFGFHGGVEGDALHSLGGSEATSDHQTADIIDAIWEHDVADDHVGHGRHHGSEGMMNYFGHSDHNALLPTETLDGFADHWDHGGGHGHGWNDGYAATVSGHEGIAHGKLRAIQDIQDDPNIDNELQTMGIGTEVGGRHGHHSLSGGGHHGIGLPSFDHHEIGMYGHSLGHGGYGHGHYGFGHGFGHGHGGHHFSEHGHAEITPVDVHHHEEMSPEEYHSHIDSLMQRYHHLEEDMRGQHGGLMDHLDEHLLHQHGHPHYHSGYDLYAYKNPWDNMRLPYHVPVENHPMMEEDAPEPGGGTSEQGGKGDNKGEEKGGPLVEAKPDEPESKPPEKAEKGKKEDDKDKGDKPKKPVKKLPDWTGAPPKIPDQRGGPQISGSIGLGATESLPSTRRKDSALQQAVAAYKSMNLTVPPALQIEALQEQLKEAEEKNNLLLGQVSKVRDAQLSSGDVAAVTSASVPTNDTNAYAQAMYNGNVETEPAETKTKRPDKQNTDQAPNGAAEVTRLIQEMSANAAKVSPVAAARLNRLQQLNFIQQSLLKNMLTNAAGVANQPAPEKAEPAKAAAQQTPLLQPNAALQKLQLLQLLRAMQYRGGTAPGAALLAPNTDAAAVLSSPGAYDTKSAALEAQKVSCNERSCVPEAEVEKDTSEATSSTESDADGINKAALQGLLANLLMKQGALMKSSPSKGNPLTPTIDETGAESDTGARFVESAKSLKYIEGNADGPLASVLSSTGVVAGKRGKNKKKHHKKVPDNPYSGIGYEESSNSDNSKISFANSLALSQRSEANTASSARAVEKTGLAHSPIEAPFSTDGDEVFSKKAEIRAASMPKS